MRITSLKHLPNIQASVVTLGVFDGVHLAHRKIIKKTIAEAKHLKAKSIVITFEKHPKKTTHKKAPLILTTTTKKIDLIRKLGVDILVLVDFNKKFASIPARSFIENILVRKLKVRKVVVGHDYGFGKGKEGNAKLLKNEGKRFGFKTLVTAPVLINNKIISSTRIRSAVRSGDISTAKKYLGRDYSVIGKVEQGKKLGRTFGFPTANLNCFNEVVPKEGVYAVRIRMNGKNYKGACSITSPTFDRPDKPAKPEVFIFNFKKNIYNKVMEVYFIKKIRGSRKFNNIPALVKQINRDIAVIKKLIK
ncbi:MAG: riboflavin biosynthesis protein RibF [Candidatus Firestonebacteria bacterium RIFOXYC2_FULL_39_67]|nr:MAG: riboflavin biosynthesis protein RibF [Candidatus Firestonebacteria bacterium RIFOXYD2_FULL_39_29]OGF53328.1 MAG: riboflavin biosynthesis protein RibF [Candidatus Firestonebacteria bacterium RIFOXYC2_FULL_39_67]OGF55149.1 MAG: riboflavin biosynthesis protein RibF [Candidatus Firestonebacteria bacterium RifOxyC12_full_39_7]